MCFIRINPSTAPLTPPGAAPTLTTIYDEAATTISPNNSFPQEPPPTPEPKPKRRKRSSIPFGAKAAKEVVVGTDKEKRRTQTIADSLDLGGDLQTYVETGERSAVVVAEGGEETMTKRTTTAAEMAVGSVS